MAALGRYILSVTSAAILFGILQTLPGKKGCSAALVRLIGGLFLAFTVISSVSDVNLNEVLDPACDFTAQGQAIAAQGHAESNNHLHSIIKEQCQAYILDKAMTYNAQLEVEVKLSRDEIPVPAAVQLRGNVSPYARTVLQQWLQDEMGIPRENQQWIG